MPGSLLITDYASESARAITMTVDGVEATLRELTVELPDGDTGYYQRGQECLRAAVATATQTPYDEVPSAHHIHELMPWLIGAGFNFDSPPDPFEHRRWIAMDAPTAAPAEYTASARANHVVVGSFDRIYFDPAAGWEFAGGLRAPTPAISDLTSFYTLTERQ